MNLENWQRLSLLSILSLFFSLFFKIGRSTSDAYTLDMISFIASAEFIFPILCI
jgi:hypothetical protein